MLVLFLSPQAWSAGLCVYPSIWPPGNSEMARLACAVVLLLRGVAAQSPSLPPALPPSSPLRGFVPGAICDGVDLTDFSYNLLRGRHMVVLETTYVPFAFKDVDSPTGWSGYDLDLLAEVSKILGFTYEVKGMETREGENWSEMLLRTVGQGDLWMSWWARTAHRMNQTSMLAGHVDISPVLAIPPPSLPPDQDLSKTFTTFFDPFSSQLWICLIAMIFLSGVTDWILERPSGGLKFGGLTGSLYEYFGGVLFGGFSDPFTRLSCIYQCIVAFIILIVVSAYTANLASAMTISRQPEALFGSIDEVIATKTAACVAGSYSGQGTIEVLYPSLMYDKDTADWFDSIDDGLLDGSCQCAVIPRIEYDTWCARPTPAGLSSHKRAPAPSLSLDEVLDACWQAHRGPELPAGHRGRLTLLRLRRVGDQPQQHAVRAALDRVRLPSAAGKWHAERHPEQVAPRRRLRGASQVGRRCGAPAAPRR